MTEEIYDQAQMLAKLPKHKKPDLAHLYMPRYKEVARLLETYKYDQQDLQFISKLIASIKPYAEDEY